MIETMDDSVILIEEKENTGYAENANLLKYVKKDFGSAEYSHSSYSHEEVANSCKEQHRNDVSEKCSNENSSEKSNRQSFSQSLKSTSSAAKVSNPQYKPAEFSTLPDQVNESLKSPTHALVNGELTKKKRKKRTKEDIIAERAAKQLVKEQKIQKQMEKKYLVRSVNDLPNQWLIHIELQKQMELERNLARFEREVSAAKKSKCEQNLFCLVSLDLLTEIENLCECITRVFEQRAISDQLIFDGSGSRICWKRNILQGDIENGEFVRSDKLMYEQFCILSFSAMRYSQFKSSEEIANFIEEYMITYPFPSPLLTVVVYGTLKMRKEKIASFVLEIFERYKAQTRFVSNAEEYAMLVAQMHRSIARSQMHSDQQDQIDRNQQNQPIVDIKKGVTEGSKSFLVSDWWMKMLSQIHRMGTDAQRTIVTSYPNPHILSEMHDLFYNGIQLIAQKEIEHGRKIGPALARKIYLMLTSTSGTEIIDED
ncbi:unnamed protein product [Thelazia callipaeda]|uniref:Crossover junction endonuclease MUS81 n=1 Tax=Thelazia callipaeda TaxID=103827 RepID=A0A0N5CW86_THECL|nr:unnamed protein product [Thelazia callipaeda]